MKIFKLLLSVLMCLLFSSCIYKEESTLNSELNESGSAIDITSETFTQTAESSASQVNAPILLPNEIQAFIDIDWRIEYPEMINVYYKDRQVGTPWGMPMYFVDIDSDNTYELITKIGSYASGGDLLFLYNYDSTGIQHIGTINGGSIITDNFENDLKITCDLSDEIISIYLNKETNTYSLLSCEKYSSGGVYGYTIYFNSPDNSGTYHSEAIGSIYSGTNNYTPPYNWNYTLGNIDSPKTSKESFEEHIMQYIEPCILVRPTQIIESRLYSDIFLGNTPVEDGEYLEMISLLEKDIYDKYTSMHSSN